MANRDQSEKLHQLFRQIHFQRMMYIELIKKLKAQKKEADHFFNEAVELAKIERDRLVTVVFAVMSSG